jgi:hypothetical protein
MKKHAAVPARRGSGLWLQGMACGALVTLATPTALVGGVLLLPTIIVYFVDRTEGRPTLRAVLLFGLAASVRPLLALWSGGHSMELGLSLLSDPATTVLAWSAQGGGWLLAQFVPLLMRLILEAQARIEIARLRGERQRLAEEWGLPAADATADESAQPTRAA